MSSTEDFYYYHILSLALRALRVSSQRITSILREPVQNGILESSDLCKANQLLKNHSDSLPMLKQSDWDAARKIYDANKKAGISILCIKDSIYPKYLQMIKDAPPILFVKGALDIFDYLPGVAVVGSRKASPAGLEIARRISKFMAEENWSIVSGLALGIDASAHKGALDGNGRTIAILAGGLGSPTPKTNEDLAYKILDSGGAWISEHSIGVPARKEHFVPRNRIQIGLSAGSIIVEANIKSGSITQAKFCIGQNRPLFSVVPHKISNPAKLNCEGTIHIVQELGAIPVKTKGDYPKILSILENERTKIV